MFGLTRTVSDVRHVSIKCVCSKKITQVHVSSTTATGGKLRSRLCQHPVESVLHAGQERGKATSIIQIRAAEHSAGGDRVGKIEHIL